MDAQTVATRPDLHIIDVREGFEWHAGHIERAQHIPMAEIPERFHDIPGDRGLVVVCRTGQRSEQVARFLRDKGFEVDNLDGGMKAWMRAGLAVVTSGGSPGKVV